MNLFAYGTLMFPEVWRAVVGRDDVAEFGHVFGYEVRRVCNGVYPVMIPGSADAIVRGLIYRDLDDATITALDVFESNLYDRVRVDAILASGARKDAHAYVLPRERAANASHEPWDSTAFERDELAAYLRAIQE